MLLLNFAVALLLAVLISSLAKRTILSTAVLFLAVGFALGEDTLGVLALEPGSPIVATLAELALFTVLFSDGIRIGFPDLRSAWRLPGRALGWGLPLTLGITALLAHYVAGLGWPESLLIGAVAGIPAADTVFHLVALTIVLSIVAHSSTDVVVARFFDDPRETPAWHGSR